MIKGAEKFGPALAAAIKRAQGKSHIFRLVSMDTLTTAMKENRNINAPVNTMAINSTKNITKLHREFLRNVLQLYTYTFLYMVMDTDYSVELTTQRIELERLSNPKKAEDKTQEVKCDPPTWLKNSLPTINVPKDVWYRASHAWLESGAMVNAFTFKLDKESQSTVVTGVAGFLKRALRHGGSAADRANSLEYGGAFQPARPLMRFIYSSKTFQDNYKKLVELMSHKLPVGELKAIAFANKVDKHMRDLSFSTEEG